MKRVLYLILKSSSDTYHTLEELKNEGYNMTLISIESLRHAVEEFPEEHHFLSLARLEHNNEFQESIMCIFVGDEDRVNEVKSSIRRLTDNFSLVRGFMFSKTIEDYEGSIYFWNTCYIFILLYLL